MGTNTNTAPGAEHSTDLVALEDLLVDLEMSPEEEIIEPLEPVLEHEVEMALEAEIIREEVYAEAESDTDVSTETPAPAVEKKVRAAKAAAKPKAPAIVRDLVSLPIEAFRISTVVAPDDKLKGDMIAARPQQKKIAEKFDEVIVKLNAGRRPSRYTMDAIDILVEHDGEATSKELIEEMVKRGHATSTANSQVGQMMVLFPVLGIAKRDGNKLTVLNDSAFLEKLRKVAVA